MKLKNFSLIAATLALSLTATSFAVKAQTTSQTPLLVAQVRENGRFQSLGLTDAQKAQMQEIRRNTRTKIEGILTPEQKQNLQAAMQARQGQPPEQRGQGQRRGKDFASLNLTEEQKTQMREIRESEKKQIEAILTPEQLQKLQQFKENRRSRGQQPNS